MLKSMLTRLREARLREFEGEEAADAGFTLIELMVVLLIIAILLAIAIPTFLGVSGSANDRAAQSNLTNALTEVKALYQNGQSYARRTGYAAGGDADGVGPGVRLDPGRCVRNGHGTTASASTRSTSDGAADGAGCHPGRLEQERQHCWYAVDLEAAPTPRPSAVTPDRGPLPGRCGRRRWCDLRPGSQRWRLLLTQAGVYYSQVTVTAGTLQRHQPDHRPARWTWGNHVLQRPER